GKKSAYTPQTLLLELIGDPAEDGSGGYEAIPSGLQLELEKPTFLAVTVRLVDTNDTGISFFMKELSPETQMRKAHVVHRVTANHQSNLPLILGGRDPEKNLAWDGWIGNVRLSNQELDPAKFLLADTRMLDSTVGCWRFEDANPLKDSSANGNNI